MSDVLDLNALIPQPRKVKFGELEIEIKPPKTADILKLGVAGQKLQNLETLKDDEVDKLVADLTANIYRMVPELNSQELTNGQLFALVGLIVEMGMPPEAEELKKRGITVDTPKKAP